MIVSAICETAFQAEANSPFIQPIDRGALVPLSGHPNRWAAPVGLLVLDGRGALGIRARRAISVPALHGLMEMANSAIVVPHCRAEWIAANWPRPILRGRRARILARDDAGFANHESSDLESIWGTFR
jgi:hypothetical protein